MKTEGKVKQKVKQVVFRHRKNFVVQGLARRPGNCRHNRTVHLPVHMANRATLGVCGYCHEEGESLDVVCDSTMGGDTQAADCPYFSPAKTAKELKEEFNAKLGLDGTAVRIGYIAKEYPDVAALMWVLGGNQNANTEAPPREDENNILALFGDGETEEEPESVPEQPLVEAPDE